VLEGEPAAGFLDAHVQQSRSLHRCQA
jgi:hypothetical protein